MNYHTELNIQSGKYFNPRILFNFGEAANMLPYGKRTFEMSCF